MLTILIFIPAKNVNLFFYRYITRANNMQTQLNLMEHGTRYHWITIASDNALTIKFVQIKYKREKINWACYRRHWWHNTINTLTNGK